MSQLLQLTSHSDDCSSIILEGETLSAREKSHKLVTLYTPMGDLLTIVWEFEDGGWQAKLYLPDGTKVRVEEKNGQLTGMQERG